MVPVCASPTCQPQDGFLCAYHAAIAAVLTRAEALAGALQTGIAYVDSLLASKPDAVSPEFALCWREWAMQAHARLAAWRARDEAGKGE